MRTCTQQRERERLCKLNFAFTIPSNESLSINLIPQNNKVFQDVVVCTETKCLLPSY